MRYFQKIQRYAGTYSELGTLYITMTVGVGRVVLVWDFSVAFHHQLLLFPLRKKSTTMTTNKSTIPAEEEISHNSGLCLNRAHKRRLAGTQGVWGFCIWRRLAALNLFFASSWNKQDHTAHTRARIRLFRGLDLCGSSFLRHANSQQLQGIRTAKQERLEREKRQCDPRTPLVSQTSGALGGSRLSNPVNYPQHLYFFLSFWQADSRPGQKRKICTETQ